MVDKENTKPVSSSTKKILYGIFALQYLHLPFKYK